MFFSKKKETTIDLGWLNTDIHSHLLPGIDDGVKNIEESLSLIKGLSNFGYKKIITTPHILREIYPNTREIILDKLTEVRQAISENKINIELHAAAEYFIDDHFNHELKNKSPLLILKENIVLVEFSMISSPMDFQDILFEMQLQNYQPLIAHPERYSYLTQKKSFFDELKNLGCFFQLNLLSLTGYYGTTVQELAEYLIKKNYYSFAGTDLHNEKHLQALKKLSDSSSYKKLRDSGSIKNHTL